MIFLDASIPRSVARALQQVRADVSWIADVPGLTVATPDVVWLRHCGEQSWLTITRDKKIRSRPAERRAVLAHDVGLFVLAQRQNLSRWQYLQVLTANLDEMERAFGREARPFIFNLTAVGLTRYA